MNTGIYSMNGKSSSNYFFEYTSSMFCSGHKGMQRLCHNQGFQIKKTEIHHWFSVNYDKQPFNKTKDMRAAL